MPSKKNPKKKQSASKKARQPSTRLAAKNAPSPQVLKPDIRVKRNAYSKAARLAVLASAEARRKLIEAGGENTIDVIREFDRDMSDEELAKKIGVKTSDVRIVLNRLHTCGLFSYTRIRDKDSGWYSYIWKMSEEKLREFVAGEKSVNDEEGVGVESEGYLEKNLVNASQETQQKDFVRKPRLF